MRAILFSIIFSKRQKVLFSTFCALLAFFFLLETSVHVHSILDSKFSWITKMPEVDFWLTDPKTTSLFPSPLISREAILKVRMVSEVKTAAPFFIANANLKGGEKVLHIGVDENTLLGVPLELAAEKDKRTILEKGFLLKGAEQFLYTSYRRVAEEHPEMRLGSPFILIKLEEGKNRSKAIQKIEKLTNCKVYSKKAFAELVFSSLFQKEQLPTSFFSFIILLSFLILFLAVFFFLDSFVEECALLQTLGASFRLLFTTHLFLSFIPLVFGYLGSLLFFGARSFFLSYPFPLPIVLLLSFLVSLLLAVGIALSRALKTQRRIS
jgi:hypothetical protein